MGKALNGMAGQHCILNPFEYAANDAITLRGSPLAGFLAKLDCEVERLCHPDDESDVLRSRPQSVFLAAPMEKRCQGCPRWTDEQANTFWAVEFVGAQGQEIHRERTLVDGQVGSRLGCIRVERDSPVRGRSPRSAGVG